MARPDLRRLQQSDVLTFYWDHVDDRALGVWNRLYRVPDYNDSPESIEARWRVARQMAGQGGLDTPRLLGAIEIAERVLQISLCEMGPCSGEKSSRIRRCQGDSFVEVLQRSIVLL